MTKFKTDAKHSKACADVAQRAIEFYVWAAGEGLCASDTENVVNPEDGTLYYYLETGDEDETSIAATVAGTIGALAAERDAAVARAEALADRAARTALAWAATAASQSGKFKVWNAIRDIDPADIIKAVKGKDGA